ncbi:MAG: hypothetical protein IPJ79_05580 [Bacteroidetes bacterium]|nr:hypothetical protein [Bacteroidota bacterium]
MDTLDESISFYDLENTFAIHESELEETSFNLSPYQIESINQLNGYVESQYDDQSPEFIQALYPFYLKFFRKYYLTFYRPQLAYCLRRQVL